MRATPEGFRKFQLPQNCKRYARFLRDTEKYREKFGFASECIEFCPYSANFMQTQGTDRSFLEMLVTFCS
jgi:hypothetical protein